jgi:Domain of unknown function (DUF932)
MSNIKLNSAVLSTDELKHRAPSIFASQPVAGVSDRYSFVSTASLLEGIRESGWLPVSAKQQRVLNEEREGFQKHQIRFARESDLHAFDGHLEPGNHHINRAQPLATRPEIVLTNSHDRTSAYRIDFGLMRLICRNGLVVSEPTFKQISIRHLDLSAEAVSNASHEVMMAVPEILETVHLFQDRVLTDAERLELATRASICAGKIRIRHPLGH